MGRRLMKCGWLLDQSPGWQGPSGCSRSAECGGPHISLRWAWPRPQPRPLSLHTHTYGYLRDSGSDLGVGGSSSCSCVGRWFTGCFINKRQYDGDTVSVIYDHLKGPANYVRRGWMEMRGPPLWSPLQLWIIFPLIHSALFTKWRRVSEFLCVYKCVRCARQGLWGRSETMGASQLSQKPERLATASPAGMHQLKQEK